MQDARRASAPIVCLLLALFALACGDDGDGSPDGGARADASSDGAIPSMPTKEACYAQAKAADAGLTREVMCICDKCLQEISDCSGDPGCTAIRDCTTRTGCRGPSDCYLGPGLCADVIDTWGAASLSFTLSQQLGDCAATKGCSVVTEPACTQVAAFACDGNEDCGSGQECCGYFSGTGSGYERSECGPSCAALEGDGGAGFWSQMCHPGESCSADNHACLQSQYLPDFLFRCRDTGTEPALTTGSRRASEVNCGSNACGAGEKCCVRAPKEPYCAPLDAECACEPMSTGKDAGPGDDAGEGDAG